MFGPWGAAVGGGLGLAKYFLIDKPQYNRMAKLTADTQRYSPWTGLKASLPDRPDPLSNAMAFASTGAGVGQGMDSMDANEKLNAKLLEKLDAQNAAIRAGAQPQMNFGMSYQPRNAWMGSLGTNPDQMDMLYGG